jgi:hypothetical protein
MLTVACAVKLPSTVVAVMIALPVDTAVTSPLLLTVAISVLLELQVTLLFVAFAELMVRLSCPV